MLYTYLHIHFAELHLGKNRLSEQQLSLHTDREFLQYLRQREMEQKDRSGIHLTVELDSKAR